MSSLPGIQITYTRRPDLRGRVAPPNTAGGPSVMAPQSPVMRVYADDRVVIDAERPAWYPLESFDDSPWLICLEGHVYGGHRQHLLRSLQGLDPQVREGDEAFAARVRSRVESADGDFLVVLYERISKRLAVIGDHFGRLPLYYAISDEQVLVARQQHFLLSRLAAPTVDRTALAQCLLLGYPLRARTLLEGVCRLLPGEALVVSPKGCSLAAPAVSPFQRSSRRDDPKGTQHVARQLRDSFVAACRDRRMPPHHDVLSLSGGIDSRAVGAGMRSADGPFSAVTFAAPGSPHGDERTCAADVARTLGADWCGYELDHTDPRCMQEIIDLKLGLSPIDVAFGLEYVDRVQREFPGPVAFWTGEGADKFLCDHRAIPRNPRPHELVPFIIAKNAVWEPADILALIGVRPDELEGSIHSAVTTFKDIEADDAYVHFLLSERVVRWHFEGEDRHRTAVWPIAPFYGREFVSLARAIPGGRKAGRRLYRAFLQALAPDVAALALPGGRPGPGSFQYAVKHAARDRLRNNRYVFDAYRRLRRRRASGTPAGDLWRLHLGSYRQGRSVPAPFNPQEVERIASGQTRHPSSALPVLLTAMAAVEVIQGAPSGLFVAKKT